MRYKQSCYLYTRETITSSLGGGAKNYSNLQNDRSTHENLIYNNDKYIYIEQILE